MTPSVPPLILAPRSRSRPHQTFAPRCARRACGSVPGHYHVEGCCGAQRREKPPPTVLLSAAAEIDKAGRRADHHWPPVLKPSALAACKNFDKSPTRASVESRPWGLVRRRPSPSSWASSYCSSNHIKAVEGKRDMKQKWKCMRKANHRSPAWRWRALSVSPRSAQARPAL